MPSLWGRVSWRNFLPEWQSNKHVFHAAKFRCVHSAKGGGEDQMATETGEEMPILTASINRKNIFIATSEVHFTGHSRVVREPSSSWPGDHTSVHPPVLEVFLFCSKKCLSSDFKIFQCLLSFTSLYVVEDKIYRVRHSSKLISDQEGRRIMTSMASCGWYDTALLHSTNSRRRLGGSRKDVLKGRGLDSGLPWGQVHWHLRKVAQIQKRSNLGRWIKFDSIGLNITQELEVIFICRSLTTK